ncbi:MAG: hypothetical protein Kow0096_15690 [Thiohalomonadaceae bacterium]
MLRHQTIEPLFQIPPRRRIGIFLDQQTGGGVLQKHRAQPLPDTCPLHQIRHSRRDLVQPLARNFDTDFPNHTTAPRTADITARAA